MSYSGDLDRRLRGQVLTQAGHRRAVHDVDARHGCTLPPLGARAASTSRSRSTWSSTGVSRKSWIEERACTASTTHSIAHLVSRTDRRVNNTVDGAVDMPLALAGSAVLLFAGVWFGLFLPRVFRKHEGAMRAMIEANRPASAAGYQQAPVAPVISMNQGPAMPPVGAPPAPSTQPAQFR
jgi:hypothetical protein